MKCDIHTKLRGHDYPADRFEILCGRALRRYYQHVSRLIFGKRSALLKYFGDSFFHDAEIVSIVHDPRRNDLALRLFRLNDLEDINTHSVTGACQRSAAHGTSAVQFPILAGFVACAHSLNT